MFIVKNPKSISEKVTLLKDIKDGQTFTGKISTYPNRVFLKIASRIVPLDKHPLSTESCWDTSVCPVENYCPIDIELTVIEPK